MQTPSYSWKIANPSPNGCIYEADPTSNHRHRRLMDEVTVEITTAVCNKLKGHKRDFCIADIMVTGDLELAKDPFYN